ncbi:MAG: NUDIX domain-containing protein [Acidimicrobiia bacterium]
MTSNPDYDSGTYPPFAVTADTAVFTRIDGRLCVLMIERGSEPYLGRWALPGGFVDIDEDLPVAAVRELAEETGIDAVDLRQLGAYGAPDRDPRMRVVSVVFWTFLDDLGDPDGGDDAADAFLVPIDEVLADPSRLAFDHHQVLMDAVARVEAELA